MRIIKSYFPTLFMLLLFFSFYSCKSDKSKQTSDSTTDIMEEEVINTDLENDIDTLSASTVDAELENEEPKQSEPNNKKIKQDNTKISDKTMQDKGIAMDVDEKKSEKANTKLPSSSKNSDIETSKQSENKEKTTSKEITSSNNTNTSLSSTEPDDLHKHGEFDKLLQSYVTSTGKVNYRAIKSKEKDLVDYLTTLSSNVPLDSWSRNEKMAYWINAYNAFTIKKVIDNYPLKSIQSLNGGKVWDDKFIKLGSKLYSLNEIENQILRPIYKDARIHFAVNCAAKSCPPLANKAFTSSNLTQMLERNTKDFINDGQYNTIAKDKSSISKIFDWYKVDFDNMVDYINKYSSVKVDNNTKILYRDYDWGLNE